MSNNSANSNFDVQKWNEATKKVSAIATKRILPALRRHKQEWDEYNKSMFGNPSVMRPSLEYRFDFAADITAPNGTYPHIDDLVVSDKALVFYMSPDVFACFQKGPSLCMKRFVAGVIMDFNLSQDSSSIGCNLVIKYAGVGDGANAGPTPDLFTIKVGVKIIPVVTEQRATTTTPAAASTSWWSTITATAPGRRGPGDDDDDNE